MLYVPRMMQHLQLAMQFERTITGSRAPMVWYSHFGWAYHGHGCTQRGPERRNSFCGMADLWMQAERPWCRMSLGRDSRFANCTPTGLLGPFPFGTIEIRSRSFAALTFHTCNDAVDILDRFNWTDDDLPGMCDGNLGVAVGRCLVREWARSIKPSSSLLRVVPGDLSTPPVVGVWHLTNRHHRHGGHPPRQHTVVVHNRRARTFRRKYPLYEPLPASTAFEHGPALLPFRFALGLSMLSPLVSVVTWNATSPATAGLSEYARLDRMFSSTYWMNRSRSGISVAQQDQEEVAANKLYCAAETLPCSETLWLKKPVLSM